MNARYNFTYVLKTIGKGLLISVAIAIVILSIQYFLGRKIILNKNFAIEIGYYCLYGIVLSFVNATFFDYLNHVVVWDKFTKYRLLIGALGSVLLTMISIFFIRLLTIVGFEDKDISSFVLNEKFSYYLVSLLITIIVSLLFHLVYFYKSYQENRVKQEKIIAGNASAQFESLKNQLDPHFLFNSLNVLSSLIEENPENAQKFTTSLSKIYRYVLEQRDKELVSVAEELKFAKTYMNLLKMRFENSITFELPEVFENEDAKVVPLALQLLLENAIKHNVVSEQKPLHIKISIEGNQLIVENNLQKKETLQTRKGVGLQNIVDRYAIITTRSVAIEETNNFFRIKLPILTKQLNTMEITNNYNEENAYYKAKKRVEELKSFYSNLASYCLVIPFLIFINYKTTSFQWFWFPMLGWGMGLSFHAFAVFGYGKSWEEKKIKELLKEEENKNNKQNWK
uniref:2TM domain-containing protein n=1 Tax=Flavobacterium sp. TaxID=239 RepID=UPI00404B5177